MEQIIKQYEQIAIYGAQVVAYGVYTALRTLYDIMPDCFIVSHADGNPTKIDDIPVRTLDSCGLDKQGTLLLVAVTELLQDEICATLESNGFCNYIRIGAHEEHLLMSQYFESIGRFPLLDRVNHSGKSGRLGCDLIVYEAKNHCDKQLQDSPQLAPWECSIQAGAAMTDRRIAELTDDTGDNISKKNHMYSEMTATYWVWKNTTHKWKGICHYRRHLVLNTEQMNTLLDGDADVLLPLPYICYPDTLSQFRRFVSEDVKTVFLQVLQELNPAHFDEYLNILNGKYQYTYNLLCARTEVFENYCSWVFPVLQSMERFADIVPEIAETRALSYTAEVLTSLYFLSNFDKWKIQHVEKAIFI